MLSLNKSPKNLVLPVTITLFLFIIVLCGTFFMGMRFGEFRASYNAMRHFRDAGFPPDIVRSMRPGNGNFGPGKHGIGGIISSLGSGSVVLQRMDGKSQTILVSSNTALESKEGKKNFNDLSLGTHVIAIGKPNANDEIEAILLLLP